MILEAAPTFSLDQLLVGAGGLGVLAILVKGFLTHLEKRSSLQAKVIEGICDRHLKEVQAIRDEALRERSETREQFRKSLDGVVSKIHGRLDTVEGKLDDIGGWIQSLNNHGRNHNGT